MICHQYKCLFVHIPKNAGRSIERVFSELLNINLRDRDSLLLKRNKDLSMGPPRLSHLKTSEYLLFNYISQEEFDSYFKFSIVRNPWDRMISIYKHFGYIYKCEFKKFLFNDFRKQLWDQKRWFVCCQCDFICDSNGKQIVDFVGKYENLQEDFNYVCNQIGISPIELPHINRSDTKRKRFKLKPKALYIYFFRTIRSGTKKKNTLASFGDYYDQESAEFVSELYERDIDLFGYEFPDLK